MKMAAREPLKVVSYIERNGKIEKFNGYTDEEKAAISKALSKTMSQHFALHPEEFARV